MTTEERNAAVVAVTVAKRCHNQPNASLITVTSLAKLDSRGALTISGLIIDPGSEPRLHYRNYPVKQLGY